MREIPSVLPSILENKNSKKICINIRKCKRKGKQNQPRLDRRARLQKTCREGDQWNWLNLTKISKPIESRDNGAYRDAVSQIFHQFSYDRYHAGIRPKSQVSLACTRRGNAPWPCINPASRWYTLITRHV